MRFRLVFALAFAVLLVHQSGRTCTVAVMANHVVDPTETQVDTQPPAAPEIPRVDVHRPTEPHSGCDGTHTSSCDGIGTVVIPIQATDDRTTSDDMGYRVSLASGTPPATFNLPTKDVRANRNVGLVFFWTGGEDSDLDFELRITAVDRGGNVSAMGTVVRVLSEHEGGCSVAHLRGSSAWPWGWVAALAIAWARRRPRHAV